jgi:hypothetical protein
MPLVLPPALHVSKAMLKNQPETLLAIFALLENMLLFAVSLFVSHVLEDRLPTAQALLSVIIVMWVLLKAIKAKLHVPRVRLEKLRTHKDLCPVLTV